MANNLTSVDRIIGLPPSSYISDAEMHNSMPTILIYPQKPKLSSGTTLFTLQSAEDDYTKIINNLGFSPSFPITVAFQAEALPTETISNDYTETFLQKFTDVASQGISQLMQMTGSSTLSEGAGKIGSDMVNMGEKMKGGLGQILKTGGGGVLLAADELKSFQTYLKESGSGDANFLGGAAGTIDKMMAGHRVDYPKVWGNSAYSSTFSISIKLFNPRPGHSGDTNKYIIGPLAILLALGTPRTGDGYSYNWPFFHKVIAPGFFRLDPAVITNISIVKGGDHQQLAFTKTLGMVDVRIDFASLYESMVVEEPGTPTLLSRPTVKNYLDNLQRNNTTNHHTNRKGLMKSSSDLAGVVSTPGSSVRSSTFPDPKNTSLEKSKENILTKNLATSKMLPSTNLTSITDGVTGRVPAELSSISSANESLNKDFITANIPKLPNSTINFPFGK
jgi:hypothetical protein